MWVWCGVGWGTLIPGFLLEGVKELIMMYMGQDDHVVQSLGPLEAESVPTIWLTNIYTIERCTFFVSKTDPI